MLLTEHVWMTRVWPLIDDRALKVIDTVDVFSSKAAKVLRFGIRDLWLSESEEARRLAHADLVIAIQEEERETLQSLVSGPRVVTAAIDFDVCGDPALPDGYRVLFVGSGNRMNVTGVEGLSAVRLAGSPSGCAGRRITGRRSGFRGDRAGSTGSAHARPG